MPSFLKDLGPLMLVVLALVVIADLVLPVPSKNALLAVAVIALLLVGGLRSLIRWMRKKKDPATVAPGKPAQE